MTSKVFSFLAGLLVGAAACAMVLTNKSPKETAPAVSDDSAQSEIAELKSQLQISQSRLEKAHAEIDRLTASAQELMARESAKANPPAEKPQKSGFAALFGGDGTNGMSEAMSGMMQTAIEQQMEGKIAAMKAKLNLTPEQEAAIREIMAKQMTKGAEIAQRMFKGELSKEEFAEMGQGQFGNEEKQIKDLLTPEQAAAYDEYEKEERMRMVRLAANGELMQMQSSLQLTDAQQDQVFDVLVGFTQAQFEPKADASDALDFKKQFEKKADALRGILSPEQLERYKKFQEQQLRMMEMFMPKATSEPTRSGT